MLFDPRGHEPLHDAAWDPAAIRAAIRAMARDADAALRDGARWPVHPLDAEPGDPEVFHGIYLGAAGMVWALDRLARDGLHEPGHDYARLAGAVLDAYRRAPEYDGPEPSLFMGEGGIALVAWLLAPSPALEDRLAALVTVEPARDTLELLWGSPGTLRLADALLERTGAPRWAAAWSAVAEYLMGEWGAHEPGVWTQRLYGTVAPLLGPAHGLAGIVAALARRPDLLAPERLAPGVTAVLSRTAVREGALANWPPGPHAPLRKPDGSIRTQWCHGAPGMVASLSGLPAEDELDGLLAAGGELTWTAGPLRKGAGLCHGTAGNGFALLKLFTRTQDERWLQRARRFAMHAAAQVQAARSAHGQGRFSLWTGDLGAALYLGQCLAGGSALPALDRW